MLSGHSVFRVFIHSPGGRKATLSYLETLNLYSSCARCHGRDGIFSVNTYNRLNSGHTVDNQQLLPASAVDNQLNATVDWKRDQFNWGLLRGMLEAEVSTLASY